MSIHDTVDPVIEARSLAVSHCIGITALMSGVKAYGLVRGLSSFGEANAGSIYYTREWLRRKSDDGIKD